MVLGASGSGAVPWPGGEDWKLSNLFAGAGFTVDAGAQILWQVGESGDQSFSLTSNLDGPVWCEMARSRSAWKSWDSTAGNPWTRCLSTWGALPITQPGIHSADIGASTGAGASAGVVLSCSVLIGCSQWYSLTQTACPPSSTLLPTIGGSATVGQALSASEGNWATVGTITGYSYRDALCLSRRQHLRGDQWSDLPWRRQSSGRHCWRFDVTR